MRNPLAVDLADDAPTDILTPEKQLVRDLQHTRRIGGCEYRHRRAGFDEQQLRADVEEHGVTVKDEKRGMNVENRSVSLGVMVSRQMLQIYTALGFKEISGAGAAPEKDDDEL